MCRCEIWSSSIYVTFVYRLDRFLYLFKYIPFEVNWSRDHARYDWQSLKAENVFITLGYKTIFKPPERKNFLEILEM